MEKTKTSEFPLADNIESVLKEMNLSYQNYPIAGGFDVRATKGFLVQLPKERTRGLLGLLGKKNLIIHVGEIIKKINDKLYHQPKALYRHNRDDLKKTSIRNDKQKFVTYIENSPKELRTSYFLLDVVNIAFN
jgi:hypothetical protein